MKMSPSEVYESLLNQLAEGELNELQRRVFNLLREHAEGLTRYDLVEHIYGYRPETVGGTHDRKIRKAIETLRKRLFPIVSTSSQAGYRLDVTKEAAEKMMAELQSRKERLQEQINAVSKFYQLPTVPTIYKPPPRRIRQKHPAGQMELGI